MVAELGEAGLGQRDGTYMWDVDPKYAQLPRHQFMNWAKLFRVTEVQSEMPHTGESGYQLQLQNNEESCKRTQLHADPDRRRQQQYQQISPLNDHTLQIQRYPNRAVRNSGFKMETNDS